MTISDTCGPTQTPDDIDIDALREKYAQERAKRLRPDGSKQYVELSDDFAGYYEVDPYTPVAPRDPINEDIDVAVLGGGFGGLLSAAHLKKAGVEDVRIIELGGDFGGVWYWNRYPGIQCDNESYCYIPLLEELDYIPSKKFADGPEIYEHCRRIGKHFGLYDSAIFSTQVRDMRWDEDIKRWRIATNRGDDIRARFVVLASGPFHRPKLPGIPGMKDFKGGHSFHSSRWDYDYTGGDYTGGMDKLADKRVAIIGTGATSIQVVPFLARDAQHLYVFQRTPPSTVDVRNNTPPTDPTVESLQPGWQKERQRNFHSWTFEGDGAGPAGSGVRLLDRARPQHRRAGAVAGGPGLDDARAVHGDPRGRGLQDHGAAAPPDRRHRRGPPRYRRGAQAVLPVPVQAAAVQRRLPADVQPAQRDARRRLRLQGRRTDHRKGIVANGQEYEVDCIIYASGFEITTEISRRYSIDAIDGRDGTSLYDYWRDGYKTLHGMTSRGFPNQFFTGFTQVGISANIAANYELQGEHIAYIVAEALNRGATVVEPTAEAQDEWCRTIRESAVDNSAFDASCTPPGYYNNEGGGGGEGIRSHLGEPYGPGFYAFGDLLKEWRDKGDLDGLELRS